MNKDLSLAIQELNEYILNLDIVKEFQYYEKLVLENDELKTIEITLKSMQKDIVNKKHRNEDCEQLVNDYQKLKNHFENHPLVYNYLMLKQEVNELLQTIQNDLNRQLKLKAESNAK